MPNSSETSDESTDLRPTWPVLIIVVDLVVFAAMALLGRFSQAKQNLVEELKQSETIMEDTTSDSRTVDPTKKELPVASRELLKRPAVAYPTVALLILSWMVYIGSLVGYLTDRLEWWQCIIISTIAVYWSFTVLHDAVHIAVAPRVKWLNELCGNLAGFPLFTPLSLFRFIHLSHHRYNGDEELDPDTYTGQGSEFQLPFRWLTIFYYYLYWFERVMKLRLSSNVAEISKAKDRALQLQALLFFPLIVGFLFGTYFLFPADKAAAPIVCILLPQHFAAMWLAYLFDYVPHRPHKIFYKEDPFKSTNATSLFGSVDNTLWNWMALGQQLHIVHHLWPFLPFYSYKDVWAVHGDEIVAKGTRIVPLFLAESKDQYFDELRSAETEKKTN